MTYAEVLCKRSPKFPIYRRPHAFSSQGKSMPAVLPDTPECVKQNTSPYSDRIFPQIVCSPDDRKDLYSTFKHYA